MLSSVFLLVMMFTAVAAMPASARSFSVGNTEQLQQFLNSPEIHHELKELLFNNIKLTSDEMVSVADLFHKLHWLERLDFYFCDLNAERFQTLARALGKLTKLKEFSILNDAAVQVSGSAGIRELMNFLPNLPLLRYIELSNTFFELTPEDLALVVAAFNRRSLQINIMESLRLYFPYRTDVEPARNRIIELGAAENVKVVVSEEEGDYIESQRTPI